MRTPAAQALRNKDDHGPDGAGPPAGKAKAPAFIAPKAKPEELLPKEIFCCSRATD